MNMERYDFRREELGDELYDTYKKSGYTFYISHKDEFYVQEHPGDEDVSRVGNLQDVMDYLDY